MIPEENYWICFGQIIITLIVRKSSAVIRLKQWSWNGGSLRSHTKLFTKVGSSAIKMPALRILHSLLFSLVDERELGKSEVNFRITLTQSASILSVLLVKVTVYTRKQTFNLVSRYVSETYNFVARSSADLIKNSSARSVISCNFIFSKKNIKKTNLDLVAIWQLQQVINVVACKNV